jgi:hypothetical protein
MKKIISLIFILCFSNLSGQGTSGTNAKYEYLQLVDLQTSGILQKGLVGISFEAMPFGVVITNIEVGIFDGFCMGLSYGGGNIIGSGNINWNKLPGINLRGRIIDETQVLPSITIGFDSQGKGVFDNDINRYQIKSPGFFAAGSKTFELLGYFSIHGTINYTLERNDDNKSINFGVGFEKTIGAKVSIIGEYDFGINDNSDKSFGKGDGYLNVGVRWSIGDGLTLGINLRDLLQNKKINSNNADRGIFVEYVKSIF